VRYGLPAQHLSELAIGLDAFEALMMPRDPSIVTGTVALAELKKVGHELVRVAVELGAFLPSPIPGRPHGVGGLALLGRPALR